jgi:hypothetical protein
MTFDRVPAGASMFVDSNILVYHFQPHPIFGPLCHRPLIGAGAGIEIARTLSS